MDKKSMFGLGESGNTMKIDLNLDISKELAMLRGIDFARRNSHYGYDRIKILDEESSYPRGLTNEAFDREVMLRRCEENLAKREMEETFEMGKFKMRKVVFNDPATIIIWEDGTKTVVKCGKDEIFDPEKGLAMAISKRALGNKGNYYEIFKKLLPKEITVKEYSILYKISESTVRRMIKDGDLHAYKSKKGHWIIPLN